MLSKAKKISGFLNTQAIPVGKKNKNPSRRPVSFYVSETMSLQQVDFDQI